MSPNSERRGPMLERKQSEYHKFVEQYYSTRHQDIHRDTYRQVCRQLPFITFTCVWATLLAAIWTRGALPHFMLAIEGMPGFGNTHLSMCVCTKCFAHCEHVVIYSEGSVYGRVFLFLVFMYFLRCIVLLHMCCIIVTR